MQLCIKLIEVEGSYKALVLDLSRKGNRIDFIFEGTDKDQVWDKAQAYIDTVKVYMPQDDTQWH